MASPSSFADVIHDWEKLLAAYAANATSLTAMEPQRLELEALLAQARELKNRHEVQKSINQEVTKETRETVTKGLEIARRLRSHAKAVLGTDSELLVGFQVAPRRERGSRKKAPQQPEETPQQSNANGASPSAKSSEPSAT